MNTIFVLTMFFYCGDQTLEMQRQTECATIRPHMTLPVNESPVAYYASKAGCEQGMSRKRAGDDAEEAKLVKDTHNVFWRDAHYKCTVAEVLP